MARRQPCGAAACAPAGPALLAFKRAKAAEAGVAEKRALLGHLAEARQQAIDEQQSAARDAPRGPRRASPSSRRGCGRASRP